jgi:hypothetical protein
VPEKNIFSYRSVQRITALWAASEALLGGLLHLFKVPFTGLVIGGAAVVFIVLLSEAKQKGGEILKATFVVMIIKAMMAPNTPVNAYLALFTQGIVGEYLLRGKGFLSVKAAFFGFLVLLLSASQKIITLTIIYGNNLWDSLNIFSGMLAKQFGVSLENYSDLNIAVWLILFYLILHALIGLGVGIWASLLPEKLSAYRDIQPDYIPDREIDLKKRGKKRRRAWWKKPGSLIIFGISIALYLLSFYDPQLSTEVDLKPVILIVRSVLILTLWFYWLGPHLVRFVRSRLQRKRTEFGDEVDRVAELIPHIKHLIAFSWKRSEGKAKTARIWDFVHRLPANLLLNGEGEGNEKNIYSR